MTLRSIINRLKLEIYSLFFYCWLYPIPVLQFAIVLHSPGWVSIGMLLLGFLSSWLLITILASFDVCYRRSLVIKGFLEKYKDCKYIKYSLKDYLDEKALFKAESLHFDKFFKDIKLLQSLEDSIKVFVVKKGSSGICPSQFTTYSIPGMESYVFLRDEPDKIRSIGKFWVYHEVGHTLVLSAGVKLRLINGNKSLLFSLFWGVWIVDWTPQSILILISLILTIVTLGEEWNRRREKLRLDDEVWADNFAIESVSQEDRANLLRYFSKYPILQDSSMSNEQNIIRSNKMKENLKLAYEGKTEQLDFVSEIYAPLGIITTVILIFTIGTFTREVTSNFLFKLFFLINLPMLLVLFISIFIGTILLRGIEETINGQSIKDEEPDSF